MIVSTPIAVLVKIPYKRLLENEGQLATTLGEVLEPFDGSKISKWELASCRMSSVKPGVGWEPSGNEYEPMAEASDTFCGAAYYEDMRELTEPTWAVIDEDGKWHEANNKIERGEFLTTFDEKFLFPTAPNTLLAVVMVWS